MKKPPESITTSPLFRQEFGYDLAHQNGLGHSLALHDASILENEHGKERGRRTLTWRLLLSLPPAGRPLNTQEDRRYTYEIRFAGYGGELDQASLPDADILDFEAYPTDAQRMRAQVTFDDYEGTTLAFTYERVEEVRLTPFNQSGPAT